MSGPARVTASTRHMTASAVVIDPDAGETLLIHHKATGKLMFPGGHVDPDEAPHEAALREVFEETGLRARIWRRPGEVTGLPDMTVIPSPWITAEIPAPAKPHRGEPAHTHLDQLFIAIASARWRPATRGDEGVAGALWLPVAKLRHNPHARAEVARVAVDALWLMKG